MGRPRRHSGGHVIQHAEELFRRSVEAGRPDYSYVALAIGSAPGAPPAWAVMECIEHRCKFEGQVARGHASVSAILDDIVRRFDRLHCEFWEKTGGDGVRDRPEYKPPSLRSTIIEVVKTSDSWKSRISEADDDWMKPIREAWDWEQKHDLLPGYEGSLLHGFETTSRIDRIIRQTVAHERGEPADVAKWAWLTNILVQQQGSEGE